MKKFLLMISIISILFLTGCNSIIETDNSYKPENINNGQNEISSNIYENKIDNEENNYKLSNKYELDESAYIDLYNVVLIDDNYNERIVENPYKFENNGNEYLMECKRIDGTNVFNVSINGKKVTLPNIDGGIVGIGVIDLDKTSIIDYDTGCYSFPLGTDNFKYKVYNLFDNLKSIARILKLSVIIQNKLNQLMPCTKRELYYENVDLFKSTAIIDSNENDLCSILGICRFDLPIFPSAKGLFCGNITLVNKFGNRLNINNSSMNSKINLINYEYLIDEFYLDDISKKNIDFIQNNINIVGNNLCQKYFVLIVEKETLFFNLVGNYQFYNKFPNAIIITGKGYPDYITKIFIKKLSNQLNNVPFIYFGDHDPHGFEIYLNYVFGSTQSCKEILSCKCKLVEKYAPQL